MSLIWDGRGKLGESGDIPLNWQYRFVPTLKGWFLANLAWKRYCIKINAFLVQLSQRICWPESIVFLYFLWHFHYDHHFADFRIKYKQIQATMHLLLVVCLYYFTVFIFLIFPQIQTHSATHFVVVVPGPQCISQFRVSTLVQLVHKSNTMQLQYIYNFEN